jgi:hypothetical protein
MKRRYFIAREIVDAGGLLAYGVRWHEMYRRAAVFVDKILDHEFDDDARSKG